MQGKGVAFTVFEAVFWSQNDLPDHSVVAIFPLDSASMLLQVQKLTLSQTIEPLYPSHKPHTHRQSKRATILATPTTPSSSRRHHIPRTSRQSTIPRS